MNAQPCITVIGNANQDYDPPILDATQCRSAASDIGAELAHANCQLIVYSTDPEYIEYDVVKGYVEARCDTKRRVTLRFSEGSAGQAFPQEWFQEVEVSTEASKDFDWEVDFFKSLKHADGVLLIGGGRFVFISGLVAMGHDRPIVPVATLGGAAQHFWRQLQSVNETALLTELEIKSMRHHHWSDTSAQKVVRLLLKQYELKLSQDKAAERERRREESRESRRDLVTSAWLILAILSLILGFILLSPGVKRAVFYIAILLPPMLAGAGGSALRAFYTKTRSGVISFGLGAGFIAAALFITSQFATNSDLLNPSTSKAVSQGQHLLLFAWTVSFIAGITFDTVFAKLLKADVTRLEGVISSDSRPERETG
jgi:hypothetical protein